VAFLSGAAALGHQMVWTRAIVDVAGAGNGTFAKVVGIFFLGLSAGAWFASRWTGPARPWRRLAAVELAIGVLSAPVLFFGLAAEQITSPAARGIAKPPSAPLAGMFVPAFAMGCSLPALVGVSGAPRAVWIYALNTLGGVAGVVLAAFFIFPRLGLQNTGLVFCALNVTLGAAAWMAGAGGSKKPGAETQAPGRIGWRRGMAAFLSGFGVLGLEVQAQHQLAQVAVNSIYSSAVVLVVILLALGLGAAGAALARGRFSGTVCLLAAAACAAAPFCSPGAGVVSQFSRMNCRPWPMRWKWPSSRRSH